MRADGAGQQLSRSPTRKLLSWRLSNTMDVEFCIEAVEEAMKRHGRPDIFNTDQATQFTSPRFTGLLAAAGIRVSMDDRWNTSASISTPSRPAARPGLGSAAGSIITTPTARTRHSAAEPRRRPTRAHHIRLAA